MRKRVDHFAKSADAALVVVTAARTADRLDPEPLRRNGIDLAVAMAGDEHLGAMSLPFDEWRHEVLPVPHREDRRKVGFDRFVDVGGLELEPRGLPHQPQVIGGESPEHHLGRAGPTDTLRQRGHDRGNSR